MKTLLIHTLPLLLVLTLGSSGTIVAQNLARQDLQYKVVINHEEQYSVWPAEKPLARGWKETKIKGNYAACREYIEEVWTDMRPLSIRKMNLPSDARYRVVINHEEQYSIWPETLDLPRGWTAVGTVGDLAKCTAFIEEVWTDMRPLSLRRQ